MIRVLPVRPRPSSFSPSWLIAAILCAAASPAAPGQSTTRPAWPADLPLAEVAGVPAPASGPTSAPSLDALPEARAAYEKARGLIDDEQELAAVDVLAAAIQAAPAPVFELHALLASAASRVGQWALAQQSAAAAAALRPGSAQVHFLLGTAARRAGDLDAAIAQFRTATLAEEREPNSTDVTLAWYWLGDCLARRGATRAAEEALARFDESIWETHAEQRHAPAIAEILEPSPRGAFERRVELRRALGDSEGIERLTRWGLSQWPDDPEIVELRIRALIDYGRAADAFELCRQRLADGPADGLLVALAVEAGRSAGRLDQWVAEWMQAVRSGQRPELARRLARALLRAGAHAQAEAVAELVGELSPDDVSAALLLAESRLSQRKTERSLEDLIEFARRHPRTSLNSPAALSRWLRSPESRAALVEAVAALRLRDSADAASDQVLCLAATAADQPLLVEQILTQWEARAPGEIGPHLARGQFALPRFAWDDAKAAAGAALKLDNDSAEAWSILAQAHDGLDENDDAVDCFKKAIKLAPNSVSFNLLLARHYKRNGNTLAAQRYYQAALAADASCGEAFDALIQSYVSDRKLALAREQFRQFRASVPPDAARRASITLEFANEPFQPAHLEALKAQFARDPEDVDSGRLYAAGLFLWERLDEARRTADQLLATDPTDFGTRMLRANIDRRRGEFAAAVDGLEQLSRDYPNRSEVLELLASTYVFDFRPDDARALWSRLIDAHQDSAELGPLHEALLQSYVRFGQSDEALRVLDAWEQRYSDHDAVLLARIAILEDAGRNRQAFELVRARVQGDDVVTPAWREQFVDTARKAGELAQAEQMVRSALTLSPVDPVLTDELVTLLIEQKRADEAMQVARDFTGDVGPMRSFWTARARAALGELDAAETELDALLAEAGLSEAVRRGARLLLIDTLRKAGQVDRGIQRCDRWGEEAGSANPALRYEALTYKRALLLSAEREEEYIQVMEVLLQMQPDDPGINNDLGYSWVDAGRNVERATAMIRRAVIHEPLNAAFLDSMGWAHYKRGDFAEARQFLSRATRLTTGRDAVNFDHLGDAEYRLGDVPAAQRAWTEALRLLEEHPPDPPTSRTARQIASLRAKLEALAAKRAAQPAPTAEEQSKGAAP